jgi:hypothetical protein
MLGPQFGQSAPVSTLHDPAPAQAVVEFQGKRIYAVLVANAQRRLIYTVLGSLACMVSMCVLPAVMPGPYAPFVGLALNFVCSIIAVVQTGLMARSTGIGRFMTVVGCLVMLFPIAGLLLMVAVNARATKVLRLAGVRVGLLGVSKDDIGKLVLGACRGCGYDIRGLPSPVCPECGRPIETPIPSPAL